MTASEKTPKCPKPNMEDDKSDGMKAKGGREGKKSKEKEKRKEVLAVPPLFLQESGHSGGIPVEWDLAEGPANLFIPVDSGIYTGMFPGMVFPGMGRNGIPLEWFICLLFICHG